MHLAADIRDRKATTAIVNDGQVLLDVGDPNTAGTVINRDRTADMPDADAAGAVNNKHVAGGVADIQRAGAIVNIDIRRILNVNGPGAIIDG